MIKYKDSFEQCSRAGQVRKNTCPVFMHFRHSYAAELFFLSELVITRTPGEYIFSEGSRYTGYAISLAQKTEVS